MKRLLILVLAALLIFGCASQTTKTPAGGENASPGGGTTAPANTSGGTPPGGETTPSGGETTPSGGTTTPPAESAFAAYDLAVKDVALNTSDLVVSYRQTATVTVDYEGKQKPTRYKVTFYDNGDLVATKTVDAPKSEEKVSFVFLPLEDTTHALKAKVELFDDEKVREDGPASNNEFSRSFDVSPIGMTSGDSGKEITTTLYQAQQFTVQNKIGIGTVWVYLKADSAPSDVQLLVELRDDSGGKPNKVLKTSRIDARSIGAPQWYALSYGLNSVFLTPGKYWVVMYLDEPSANKPVWIGTGSDSFEGNSATQDKSSGYGNIWNAAQGDSAFKVSTVPQ